MNVYMDYQSTTPCDCRVLEKMLPYFCEIYANPHSHSHRLGIQAGEVLEEARRSIAFSLGCSDPRSIVFTSGATESNNLALKGVARYYRAKKNKIITTAVEHKCVMESVASLGREGFEVIFLPVQRDGILDLDVLRSALDDRTSIVSVMHANNEIGVIQPIEQIGKICREHGVLFHTDAAQSFGKIPLKAEWADLISLSGHKIYGPKGIGVLYVTMNPRIRLSALLEGGGQERGMRAGTPPVPLCVGFAEAARLSLEEMVSEQNRLAELRDKLLSRIQSSLERVYVNGSLEHRLAGNLNISFYGVEGESIMLRMPEVCVSSGSACTSLSLDGSHVIEALGVEDDLAHSSLRFSLGRFSTEEEVDYVCDRVIKAVNDLRAMSPLWS